MTRTECALAAPRLRITRSVRWELVSEPGQATARDGGDVEAATDGRQRSPHRERLMPLIRQNLQHATTGESYREPAVLADLRRGDCRPVQPGQRCQAGSIGRTESLPIAFWAVGKWRQARIVRLRHHPDMVPESSPPPHSVIRSWPRGGRQ